MLVLQRSIHAYNLSDYPKIFATLTAPQTLVGTFKAEFTGPATGQKTRSHGRT